MKILIYSAHRFENPFLQEAAGTRHKLVFTSFRLNYNTAKLAQGNEAIIVFTSDDLSAGVLDELHSHGVRFIALRSAGFDHVDLAKARKLGIKVANVPNYSPYSVAEHSVALILALNRKLLLGQKLMHQNNFFLDELIGFDLHQKTVGIVGTGNIGSAFAKIMNGFGCRLLAYDIVENEQLKAQVPLTYTNLEDLCRQSDVISIYCPLNQETHYMFNKKLFDCMKKGVLFINTARGSIVNTVDLLEALNNKTISGAGLDVYEYERGIFFLNHLGTVIVDVLFEALRNHQNVIITGHQGFLTREALTEIAQTTFNNIDKWENEEACPNEL